MNTPDYSLGAVELAMKLIGWRLYTANENTLVGGTIIETEAYTKDDPASHSFGGPRQRNLPMFQTPGTIYIYRIYGVNYCLNFVCGNRDGQAVLIRSIRPEQGKSLMAMRRSKAALSQLTDGPAKLFQALGCLPTWNGRHISTLPIQLAPPQKVVPVQTSQRIGISKNKEVLWRFYAPSSFFRDSI